MKLDLDQVLSRVDTTERDLAAYRGVADYWQKMWSLSIHERTPQEALLQDREEQVTLPTPYNVVDLGQGLFAETPKIDCWSAISEKDDDDAASTRAAWLEAFWQQQSRQQRFNMVDALAWQQLVLGRHAFDVKWVGDVIPKQKQGKMLPILIRILDPRMVGVHHGPLHIEWAYYKYEEQPEFIKQYYGDAVDVDEIVKRKRTDGPKYVKIALECIDFWYTAPDGTIWNAVIVEREFAKKPVKTDYYDIPIIVGYADSAPVADERFRGLSILHPLKELYPYENRLVSQMATWFLWHSAPTVFYQNERGKALADPEVAPGMIQGVPWGTRFDQLRVEPNLPLAESLIGKIEGMIQQATFPMSTYGQAPGGVTAGFAIDQLTRQGTRRVRRPRQNLELSLGIANELILSLIETHASKSKEYKKGVVVGGIDKAEGGSLYRLALTKKEIQGIYENTVSLEPSDELEDNARVALLLQMRDKEILSAETIRNMLRIRLPKDEDLRVWSEKTMNDPAMLQKAGLRALQKRFPDKWRELIVGVAPYEQLAQVEEGVPPTPQNPDLMPPGQAPAGGIPPDMGMPPMGPPGPPPDMGMPPEMMGGMPPDMPLQPEGAGSPLMGVPVDMMGQLRPENLGIPPGPGQGPMFDQMANQPLSDAEILARLVQGGM